MPRPIAIPGWPKLADTQCGGVFAVKAEGAFARSAAEIRATSP